MFSKVLGFGSPGAGSPMPSFWTPSQIAPTQATPPANRPSVDEWLANVRDRTDELTGRKYDSAQQQRVFLDVALPTPFPLSRFCFCKKKKEE